MYLKALTLKGFKSFADPTTIELEPGITVVVGPNGSGKSNVVDAVAWVLGAQGPRTVRSTKMEDVIFAGTTGRPALGRAEVSLTIDNGDEALGVGFAELTITRTLFRSGDSEYAVNGVPCRLLDIQDLLSDSGVGRQQHVIVSQGQLDAVLNARPEDRRMVIEEAAGVLKFRKRREKAQRRLEATEGNLLRLQDLLREVRRQLRPLERQAEAARRHDGLVAEVLGLRRHLAGRELAGLRARAEADARVRADLAAGERALARYLTRLDEEVAAAEGVLATLANGGPASVANAGPASVANAGPAGPSESLLRHEGLRERARGLLALLAERRRGIERDLAGLAERGAVDSLEAESARLVAELSKVEEEVAELARAGEEAAATVLGLEAERRRFEQEWGGGADARGGGAGELRAELAALRTSVGRAEEEMARLTARLAALAEKAERLRGEDERLRAVLADADGVERRLDAEVQAAEGATAAAMAEQAEAEAALQARQGEWHAWNARAEALALALDEARARAGAERLAEVEGVLGTLVELVDVDEGWQAAFEAAAGEAISAVVVDGVDSARRALATLHDGGCAGAVLPVRPEGPPGAPAAVARPPGAQLLRPHVRSTRPDVEALLDALLGSAVVVDGPWELALDLAVARADLVVVTPGGHRFAPSAWRAGASGTGATGAALAEARRRAAEAEALLAEAEGRVRVAREAVVAARAEEAGLLRAVDENKSRLTGANGALEWLEADRREAGAEDAAARRQVTELGRRLTAERRRVAELEARLPGLEAEEGAAGARVEAMRAARRRLDERAAAAHARRTEVEVRAAALDERRGFLTRRRAEVADRLGRERGRRQEAERRRAALEVAVVATGRLTTLVTDRLAAVEAELAELRERHRRRSERTRAVVGRLEGLRHRRADGERRLAEVRERSRRAEVAEAELRLRVEALVETMGRDLDVDPETALARECPPLPAGSTAAARLRELDRELRLLGPVNPLAMEEHAALQERHQFLEGQLDDVKASRRELAKVIRAVDAEIVDVFAAAYADVSENFTALFSTLFPGGGGRLKLTDPDHLLETGIEIEARPSGKNVRQLSLLSGGERSLTALAFLFAVFRSRPSPFYLMDEVEAALDDVNLHRFLDLVAEFRREAQLIIVSHQKRTMEAADCLYGVTMQPGGSSRVVSQRVAAGA